MKNTKEINKLDKGITLVSLIITIAVLLIVASTSISISFDRFEVNKYKKMKNDIELLSDKVENYYLKYTGLPILRDNEGNAILYPSENLEFNKNTNDNDKYYVLDLNAMEGIALNYGKEGFEAITQAKIIEVGKDIDVYIINEKTHQIYYVQGIEMDEVVYHANSFNKNNTISNIPPTKPQIKIINGELKEVDGESYYFGKVTLEFVPGLDNVSEVKETKYFINGATIQPDNNNLYEITNPGTYNIKLATCNNNGVERVVEKNIIIKRQVQIINRQEIVDNIDDYIGRVIAYKARTKNSGEDESKYSYTSYKTKNGHSDQTVTLDSTLADSLEWKILGKDEQGRILITLSEAVQSLWLRWELGYLNGVEELNKVSAIYGYGEHADQTCYTYDYEGVAKTSGARSINATDVNNITGYNVTSNSKYNKKWMYRYDPDNSTKVQYSSNGGSKWYDSSYATYKKPGFDIISTNNPGVVEDVYTHYSYAIGDSDGEKMLKYKSDGETRAHYWIAERGNSCMGSYTIYTIKRIYLLEITSFNILFSYDTDDTNRSGANLNFRPVVALSLDTQFWEGDNGILNLE